MNVNTHTDTQEDVMTAIANELPKGAPTVRALRRRAGRAIRQATFALAGTAGLDKGHQLATLAAAKESLLAAVAELDAGMEIIIERDLAEHLAAKAAGSIDLSETVKAFGEQDLPDVRCIKFDHCADTSDEDESVELEDEDE